MGSRNSDRMPYCGMLTMVPLGSMWLAKCRSCGRKSPVPTTAILARHAIRTPIHTVGSRLRCSGCGHAGADIYCAELPDP